MNPPKKPSHRELRRFCAEIHADDGIDPRLAARSGSRGGSGRKTRQLCSQAAEILGALLAECGDDALRDLRVAAVEPASDQSRLLVTLAPLPGASADPAAILERLGRRAGAFRKELAGSITRRRAPQLAFRLAPSGD